MSMHFASLISPCPMGNPVGECVRTVAREQTLDGRVATARNLGGKACPACGWGIGEVLVTKNGASITLIPPDKAVPSPRVY